MIKRKIRHTIVTALLLAGIMTMPVLATELDGNVWSDADTVSENKLEMGDELTNSEDELMSEADKEIQDFVKRLYSVCLDREPDKAGLDYWVKRLKTKEISGSVAAAGFIFSDEFQDKNLCNEDYLKYLYRAFMGREYDEGGLKYWLNAFQEGRTREDIFNGFARSVEFAGLCNKYGIELGLIEDFGGLRTIQKGTCKACGKADGVTGFVTRLYNICLNREPDAGGLEYWKEKLFNHEQGGAEVSAGFVFSDEFLNKNYSNEEFVEYMYRAFFGREYDEGGKMYWLERMEYEGLNRSFVFAGFVYSDEFISLCRSYGIDVGNFTPTNDRLTPDYVARMSYYAREKLIMGEYYGQGTISKAQADTLMTTIRIPIWDFMNGSSSKKVQKTATITCNKYLAEYFQDAFEELFNHPAQPVIHQGSIYAYSYRANVNNPSVLSNHSYGTAIDINAAENPNGKAMVTASAWAAMPSGTIKEMQKKEYTIYEGSPYYQVLYEKYHLYWLGYNRTVDAMHFEF